MIGANPLPAPGARAFGYHSRVRERRGVSETVTIRAASVAVAKETREQGELLVLLFGHDSAGATDRSCSFA